MSTPKNVDSLSGEPKWEIVREREDMVRRFAVPGGHIYQVQKAREYQGHPSNDRWEPTWWAPVFVPAAPPSGEMAEIIAAQKETIAYLEDSRDGALDQLYALQKVTNGEMVGTVAAGKDAPLEPWAIEFRNGSFLQTLEAEHGGPAATAMRFATKNAADAFMHKHEWIVFNGGMALNVDPGSPRYPAVCANDDHYDPFKGQECDGTWPDCDLQPGDPT